MLIVTIILGIVCLGIVVMAHEFGHYLAGRAVGVEVEAFSIGWGPKIASFKQGKTEWRISAFPLGGYCKFKGEESFKEALERKLPELPKEPGSLYGAAPWRRIVISVAGPLANVVLAILIFTIASTIGYNISTFTNKIVLQSEYDVVGETKGTVFPADEAGLKSGDRILSIDGKETRDFYEISRILTLSPGKSLDLAIERDGTAMRKILTPKVTSQGAGYIGIAAWAEPLVAKVDKGEAADIAGIRTGDRIVAVDGRDVSISADINSYLNTTRSERVSMTIERSGSRIDLVAILNWDEDGNNLGLSYKGIDHYVEPARSIGPAIVAGLRESWDTFTTTLIGLGTLFKKGVNLLEAISGPARIIGLAGESVASGIQYRASGGLVYPLNFLGFLSIGLFIMNLLPIPALDGGQIVMHGVEIVRRKPLKPLTIYKYQLVGVLFILGIFVLATVGDLRFFTSSN